MKPTLSAKAEFSRLDGKRGGYKSRAERHANYTLTRLLPPENYDVNIATLSRDWQSVGAQSTNHVLNKLMLTMFAPSRPFMRLEADPDYIARMQAAGVQVKPKDVEIMLAAGERKASKIMDRLPIRTSLFEILARLIVIGDVVAHAKKDEWMVIDLRDYVIRRTAGGRVATLIVREKVMFSDLDDKIAEAYRNSKRHVDDDTEVFLYRYVTRVDKDNLKESTWVEDFEIDLPEYQGAYSDDDSPWGCFTWHLGKGQHYGTGHVEDYSGDFAALSALSEAQVKGAILASEFRWLVNPGGQTSITDFEESENGAAIPGVEGDIALVANSKPGDLQVVRQIGEDYIRRIGQGFLLSSAMTRDAERVTAQEIRLQAMELETGLGGVYTRLAGSVQMFVARRLLEIAGLDLKDTQVKLTIVTGLDALSRNGDLDALRSALADIAQLQQVGPLMGQMRIEEIITAIYLGHGLDPNKYVKSQEEQVADQQAAQQAQTGQIAADETAKAQAQVPQQ